MMTPELTAAAERLVSLPTGFRWMPGMLDVEGRRFVGVEECAESMAETAVWLIDVAEGDEDRVAALPDLTDPATLGCVLAMVREAYGDPRIHTKASPTSLSAYINLEEFDWKWQAGSMNMSYGKGPSEAECLVNAIAAAAGAK